MMMNRLRRIAPLLGLLAVSCGVPTKRFHIEAVDEDNRLQVPCLVVLDYEWPAQGATNVYYTPADVDIPFENRIVRVLVKPVGEGNLGPSGQPTRVPQSTDESEYQAAERDIQITDHHRLVFILQR